MYQSLVGYNSARYRPRQSALLLYFSNAGWLGSQNPLAMYRAQTGDPVGCGYRAVPHPAAS